MRFRMTHYSELTFVHIALSLQASSAPHPCSTPYVCRGRQTWPPHGTSLLPLHL